VVELDAEGLQVEVLLVAQVRDRELADAVYVFGVAGGRELAVVGRNRLAREEVGGDVGDVFAVVRGLSRGRPASAP
jgi:hypothetical protein